ncbi:MAG: ATP-dependent sacrificial sulfur transferase LarE [Planctomycetota bacterium]|jgi:uncharacterized protein
MTLDEKYEKLREIVAGTGGLLVAFSGGVDSSFLAKVAHDVLGERSLAVTVRSKIHPSFEEREAAEVAGAIGIRYRTIEADPLGVGGFKENPPERCYICKTAILSVLKRIATDEGLDAVAEGSNASDTGDFRPGMKAVKEQGALSPLFEAGLTKDEIRELSCRLGLPTWNKPSYACLASRIPYGREITEDKLRAIDEAEEFLRFRGYRIVRVRHHGEIARIELSPEDLKRFLAEEDLAAVSRGLKAMGFRYVTLDLEGYRTGSLNPL